MGDYVSSSRGLISWIIILLFLSTSLINYDIENSNDGQEFDNNDQFRKYFSSKNSNDWSVSASASNPAVVTSIDSTGNNEFVIHWLTSSTILPSLIRKILSAIWYARDS